MSVAAQEMRVVSAEELAFALADYNGLYGHEQALMDKRDSFWKKVFTPFTSLSGVVLALAVLPGVGYEKSVYFLIVIPIWNLCIAGDLCHDEHSLDDLRRKRQALAAQYGFANHDSHYKRGEKEWWRGFYKYNRVTIAVLMQIAVAIAFAWFFVVNGVVILSIVSVVVVCSMSMATCWLMLSVTHKKKVK